MHKKLASDLTSLAHSILQMKNKDDVNALKDKAYALYEKLTVLAYVEEYINTTPQAKATKEELLTQIEKIEIDREKNSQLVALKVEENVVEEEVVVESLISLKEDETVVSIAAELEETAIEEEIVLKKVEEPVEQIIEEELESIVEDNVEEEFKIEEVVLKKAEEIPIKKIEEPVEQIIEEEIESIAEDNVEEESESYVIVLQKVEEISVEKVIEEELESIAEEPEKETIEEGKNAIENTIEEVLEEKKKVEEIEEQPFEELESLLFGEKDVKNDASFIEELKTPTLEEELKDTLPVDVMANLFQKVEPKKTVNDHLQNTIQIDLNDRIAFVKHLFNNDQTDFNRVISQLNTFKTEKEAKGFISKMVKPDYNWSDKEEYENRLLEIIERRFL